MTPNCFFKAKPLSKTPTLKYYNIILFLRDISFSDTETAEFRIQLNSEFMWVDNDAIIPTTQEVLCFDRMVFSSFVSLVAILPVNEAGIRK